MLAFWLLCVGPLVLAQDLERSKASVVKITSQLDGERRTGTGFVVKVEAEEVYIVTASHVVEGDKTPQLQFLARRNKPVKAQVLNLEGGDPRGLALLLVRGKENFPSDVRALSLSAQSAVTGGQEVFAIGFGQGQGEWAVIRANVVGMQGRDIKVEGRIEEGNSGGPLLKDGQVVGLVTGVKQGFGVATPSVFVALVLKGWGLEVGSATFDARDADKIEEPAATSPAAGQRISLQPRALKAGRKTREEGQFELLNGLLAVSVAGQQIYGKADITYRQSVDREILEIAAGRSIKERLTFHKLATNLTRELAGEKQTESKNNPLQGKTVVASNKGLSWEFKSASGVLSQAETNELLSYVRVQDEGLPRDAIPIGHRWEIVGPPLRNFLKLGDFAVSDGKASMSLEGVVPCGKDQCADISMQITLSGIMVNDDGSQWVVGLEATGRILRVVASDLNSEVQMNGQMTLTGSVIEQGVPMELAITGSFNYVMTAK